MAACAVGSDHSVHAMVLDAIEFESDNDVFFVFKNTNEDEKQIKVLVGTVSYCFNFIIIF